MRLIQQEVFFFLKSNSFTLMPFQKLDFCITIDLQFNRDGSVFRFTGVYGPSTPTRRDIFSLKFSNQNQQLTSLGLSAEILTLLSLIKT
jgi:hypothetical protein